TTHSLGVTCLPRSGQTCHGTYRRGSSPGLASQEREAAGSLVGQARAQLLSEMTVMSFECLPVHAQVRMAANRRPPPRRHCWGRLGISRPLIERKGASLAPGDNCSRSRTQTARCFAVGTVG